MVDSSGMAKILILSHSPTAPTGYGRVTRMIGDGLHRGGHEVVCIALGFDGQTPHQFPFKLYACPDARGQEILPDVIGREKPDVLLTIGDPWMFDRVPEMRALNTVTWVAYIAIDSGPLPLEWKLWLKDVDIPVTFSDYARKLVKAEAGISTQLIPHGVDRLTFRPQDKAESKATLGLGANFVVGCVARNQTRKNIPALVEAFARLNGEHSDTRLLLHTDAGTWDIPQLVERHGIADATISNMTGQPVDDRTMAVMYSAMDVLAPPTMAEGFGLPILEAHACGTVAVATDCSACTELLAGKEFMIPPVAHLTMGRNLRQAVISVDKLHAALWKIYYDWKHHGGRVTAQLAEKAREDTRRYDWFDVNLQFLNVVDRAVRIKKAQKTDVPCPRFHQL